MSLNVLAIARLLPLIPRFQLLGLKKDPPPLPGGVLDEQVALLCRGMELLGGTPLETLTPALDRRYASLGIWLLKPFGGVFEKVYAVRNMGLPGLAGEIPTRLYLPGPGPDLPLFVYLHGGGWTIGGLDTVDNITRFLCKRAGCAVLSIDYRLAPEHRFPAAVEDCLAAVQWAAEHAAALGCDPRRLLVGGDSAGGNLGAVVAQLAQQSGGPPLAGQVLFYPATESADLDSPSYQEFGERPLGLTTNDVLWYLDQYAPDREARVDPRISPLRAKDLHGLPPALVVTAEFDVLRDEGEAYARRLQQAGVPATLLRCNGMIHGFLGFIGLIPRSTRYFDRIAVEIRRLAA
jgi:acetyl esterase